MSKPVNREGRWRRLLQVGAITFAVGSALVRALLPPFSYGKDTLIDHMTARALRDGLPPFTPLRQLQLAYFPQAQPAYPYANFHPPTVWLLNWPLTFLPFEVSSLVWLGLSVWALAWVGRRLGLSWRAALALSLWPPALFHLWLAQYEILILLLIVLAWQYAARSRDWRAGLLIGAAGTLKFYPALLLLPYLIRGRWRVVAGGTTALAVGGLASLLVIGLDGAYHYVNGLTGVETRVILQDWGNSSPYVAVQRLLGGTPLTPVLDAPQAILPLTLLLVAVGLVALCWLPPAAGPVALLVLLPNSMWYCAVLALPQLVETLRQQRLRVPAIVAAILISLPYPLPAALLGSPEASRILPVWASQILYSSQAAGYLLLLGLSAWAYRQTPLPDGLPGAVGVPGG